MLSVDFAHALCLSIILHIAQAADLDDFSNNLATDLGPLLGLFGDNMAKQFLSESTTRWDYLIFALCPIGIITAIVSAIRVRGSTWLKAFIGRGHEGHASVEAELCTSTGRDVSELFNHGAITRVLGKAKLLELIQTPVEDDDIQMSWVLNNDQIPRHMGIFFSLNLPMPTSENTSEKTRSSTCRQRSDNVIYSPNISLNVGRKETKSAAFYGVAICGVILQAGLIGMAVCFTWIWTGFDDESTATRLATQAEIREAIKWKEVWFYAFGTVTLCCGLYWCAALIGGSTLEEIYVRETGGKSPPRSNDQSRSPGPRLYWIQPGGQTIGDQTFDAFAYADIDKPLKKYVTSRKKVNVESNGV
ncbi:hypothetical protein F4819DRAFT_501328 [Hypoxylon fuscum]|nr:hypothetical protein F4819DRAFT_501328 [Hypoxylon fuscum]